MKTNKLYLALAVGAGLIMLNACKVSIPKGATAVKPFNADKYLGNWYEIARLDFKFEKNLSNVTANYSRNDNGTIRVQNRGFDMKKKEDKESIGKAKFVNEENEGRLKVSFFGPFYAGYNVIDIDKDYKYALVAGNSTKYLWILSREKTIPESVKTDYLNQAKALGYDVEDLVWTKHD